MAALSANRTNSRGQVHGRTIPIPIKSAAVIYDGALVCTDANGQALPGAHGTASLRFVGYAIRGGTGIADLSVQCVVERRGTRWLPHVGTAAVTMVGKLAYVMTDNEVTDDATASTNDYIVGKIIDVNVTDNLVLVDLEDRVA
jgi:hypothetical protein